MENQKRHHATIDVDSKVKFEYLSKCTYNNIMSAAIGESIIEFENSGNGHGFPSIQVSGNMEDVKATKQRIDNMLQEVTTSQFVIDVEKSSEDALLRAVQIATGQMDCTVDLGHSSTLDVIPAHRPVRIKDDGLAMTTVSVVVSELQFQKADVIVNTVHKNFTLGVGGVSSALLKACGSGVQEELRQKYPDGIEYGQIAESGPATRGPGSTPLALASSLI